MVFIHLMAYWGVGHLGYRLCCHTINVLFLSFSIPNIYFPDLRIQTSNLVAQLKAKEHTCVASGIHLILIWT